MSALVMVEPIGCQPVAGIAGVAGKLNNEAKVLP
ncbi:Uncharacterised protein [Aeromonas encheleia]|nr:Uncharacterised protein [Aeromonas encheleia]